MASIEGRICPYLGLTRDAATHMGYPSGKNYCFKTDGLASPSPAHQENNCLKPDYINCAIYRGLEADPGAIETNKKLPSTSPTNTIKILVGVLVIAGLALLGYLVMQTRQ